MAIAFDATSSAAGTASWSHTCTGTNRILIVGAYAATDVVTGATYNSVAMTLIGKTTFGAGRQGAYLFYLINPATGSHTVAITGGGTSKGIGATSLTGALQSGQPDSSATGTALGVTSPVVAATTVVAANCWLVGVEADGAGGETAGTGTTIRQTDGNGLVLADSNGTVATGSQSLQYNVGTTGVDRAWVTASIAEVAAAASFGSGLLLKGVT